MNPALSPPVSRFFDFRLAIGITLALMTLLLLLDPSAVDLYIAGLFYQPGEGFVGRRSFWLETVVHDRAKLAVIGLGLAVCLSFIASLVLSRFAAWRRQLAYLVVAMAISTAVITPLKALTAVHCPWSLTEFGGVETHTALLSPRAETAKPGRCWPGGHASTGFSLLAFFFALRDRYPRSARVALGLALGLGVVFSVGRMLQGAHFLSHNIWTLLIDWLICVLCYRWMLYVPQEASIRASCVQTR
ncbi:phosphatase PAP2 family protein [Pseudomonas sp. v388]|uniref:phosphatase PAP2 family protein n=1 Tax=Pseudomonas sp. v388 TaxID=2479849 RepID=UPI000F783A1A|nr:phosphatase PAP2 family protein [Pseudomonas sp. v388]RRV08034.1 phosphatase PAP2 family protein [Pseudomonas sp. v388]